MSAGWFGTPRTAIRLLMRSWCASTSRGLLAVVGGILRRNQDVEDVAQQVLVKAYLSLKRFDLRSAFGTWLYKIAVNECWDYFRKKKVRRMVYEADLSEEQLRQMEVVPAHTGGASRSREDAAEPSPAASVAGSLAG